MRDFEQTGSTKSPIVAVLSKVGIAAVTAPEGSAVRHLLQCAPARPGILFVKWPGQGAHWVVIARFQPGTNGSGSFVCLDPWYGLVEWEARFYPTYRPDSKDRGMFGTARWLVHT